MPEIHLNQQHEHLRNAKTVLSPSSGNDFIGVETQGIMMHFQHLYINPSVLKAHLKALEVTTCLPACGCNIFRSLYFVL